MNSTRVPLCPPHTAGSNVWELHCTVCGIRLLEGGISIEQLVGRVESLVQEPVSATGRIRGTWVELLEEGDGQLWAYWARPARNFAGYEAVDTTNPEPTGEQLSALLLAELAGLPADRVETAVSSEIGEAWSRPKHKASRWERFKRWSRANAEREFVTIALPLVGIWSVALFTVLGWDGVKGLFAAVWSLVS
ncbi:hypothetical protein [Streptomyces scabiei]|uniref:hypothetical protein n=1 Tax=Streptomyces scabiei TaxID=1930 RepID=UPI0029B3D4CA|nr:hypothetical protein [Streptomyces scabiei]MDX3522051.1 hypothetical protein [Streptomyces scabiei]